MTEKKIYRGKIIFPGKEYFSVQQAGNIYFLLTRLKDAEKDPQAIFALSDQIGITQEYYRYAEDTISGVKEFRDKSPQDENERLRKLSMCAIMAVNTAQFLEITLSNNDILINTMMAYYNYENMPYYIYNLSLTMS